mgnify:CR=1 FL=1|jgi:putative transcriptional regulator
MEPISNLTDRLLIATPQLADSGFAQTVIYLCQHGSEGAMGLVVNRLSNYHLRDLLEQLGLAAEQLDINPPVYVGGPVSPERGFVLHANDGASWESSLPPGQEVTVTSSRDILRAITLGKGPAEFLVALGYAGWSAGQLEQEIADNAWLLAPVSQEILFRTSVEQRWHAAYAAMGVDSWQLSAQAGHS